MLLIMVVVVITISSVIVVDTSSAKIYIREHSFVCFCLSTKASFNIRSDMMVIDKCHKMCE